MSSHSLRNMLAVVAIGAATLGATFAPTGAEAFGRGGFGGGHFGGGHFGGGHFGGGHFNARNWGHASWAHRRHPRPWHPHPRPYPWPHPIRWHHHWPHPYGVGGAMMAGGPMGGDVAGTPVQESAPPVSSCTAPAGTFIAVVFVPTATSADITAFLQKYESNIADGPDKDGAYRIKVSAAKMSPADMEKLIAAIKSESTIVRDVEA